MRALLVAVALFSASALYAGGFDDMALWRYQFPGLPSNSFSYEPSRVCLSGLNTILLHTNPYGIGSLRWNFGGVKYGFGGYGIYGSYRYYGLRGVYDESRVVFGMAARAYRGAAVAASLTHERQEFGRVASCDRLDASLSLSCRLDELTAQLTLDRMNLKRPHEFPDVTQPETMASLSFRPDTSIVLSAGFKRTSYGRNRWFFWQSFAIVSGAGLHLGYMTAPNLLSGGLDFSWKSVTLALTYLAVSKLNDCVVMGVSFRT